MATGKERKQARADRYRERALQAKAGSTAAYRRSEELTKNIPSGQPILVGHHSEKRHRRALECSWNALGKSVELERKADYYAAKAEAAEHNRAISSGAYQSGQQDYQKPETDAGREDRGAVQARLRKTERRRAVRPELFRTDRLRRLYDPEQRGQYPAAEKTARKRRPSEKYPDERIHDRGGTDRRKYRSQPPSGVFPGKTVRNGTERVKIQRFSLGVDRSVLAVLSERTPEIPYRTNTEK